ncbi:MAG: enoyl-CoA hydratase/isomerase [Holophagales bacterium]|nr:enoyl-CoA hydratase/isomerase [Holophagales bacterium]MXX60605.1 enoyl-CoA hydratase/isomerase [Holophagales bacterium]MYC08505.1 enoyl-CoA hydratase/isomerase [Holophagales bacterium]MYD23640.1 enoyl-CoA hydratase/isomerase [Holophagales bacterium]MYI33888.1 enoyl-CoA hydratase/isomerase [Holophagales bacterium]
MSYERILLEQDGSLATITLNHPEVLNATDARMVAELSDAVLRIRAPESGVRALLLTGAGRAFCSGANLSGRGNQPEGAVNPTAREGLRNSYHPLLLSLRDLDMPIVTAVHGAAAGVGMSFALIGDLVCASKQAFFLQAFARIGLVPDGGATFMLPRLIGWGRAVELSLLAERLPADKAFEWGLVNRLYDDPESLMEGATELAHRLANGPRSLAMIRKAYWATWQNVYEQQLDLEARLQAEAGATEDSREGVLAFLEKRPAEFKGR